MFKSHEKKPSEYFPFIHFSVFLLQIPVAATVLIWTLTSGHLASLASLACYVKAREDPPGDEEGSQHHKSVTLVSFVSLANLTSNECDPF